MSDSKVSDPKSVRSKHCTMMVDNSWMFLQGIETLPLRMDKHCENALKVAQHLKEHNSVEWVRFPGLEGDPMNELNLKYLKGKGGSMVIFGIKGGREGAGVGTSGLKYKNIISNYDYRLINRNFIF